MSASRREAALILAMCQYVKGRIKKIEARAKEIADVEYPQEKTAATVDDKVVGFTGRYTRRPQEPFTVFDGPAFVAWVKKRWPSEVEETVRPAFLRVLADMAAGRGGSLVDHDGEVCDFVKLNDDEPYTMTKLTAGAAEVLKPLLDAYNLTSLEEIIEQEQEE